MNSNFRFRARRNQEISVSRWSSTDLVYGTVARISAEPSGRHAREQYRADKCPVDGEGYRFWSDQETWRVAHLHIPETAFIVSWAIVIIAVGAWAARVNRRWVVTTAAVFGAIEFYTQWFERLGAEPWAIIVAGLAHRSLFGG